MKNLFTGLRFLSESTDEFEVYFSLEVLDHFYNNRQIEPLSRETGGQLFAEIQNDVIYISSVTGPRKLDSRGRFFFAPIRWLEQREIKAQFNNGLHYVGDWHTHPQQIPEPSALDIKSMRECFVKSKHELPFFILVIVGQVAPPAGISVSIHNDASHLFLVLSNR